MTAARNKSIRPPQCGNPLPALGFDAETDEDSRQFFPSSEGFPLPTIAFHSVMGCLPRVCGLYSVMGCQAHLAMHLWAAGPCTQPFVWSRNLTASSTAARQKSPKIELGSGGCWRGCSPSPPGFDLSDRTRCFIGDFLRCSVSAWMFPSVASYA